MELQNNTFLITGAGSGMGAATAEYLQQQGARTVLIDRNAEAVAAVAEKIGAMALTCDVTDSEQAQAALEQAIAAVGEIRGCINCAGIAPAQRIVGREGPMPLENFTQVIQVNLIGSFNMLRLVAAHMSELAVLNEDEERGIIINTASIAAYDGQIGQAAYSASKGGIVAMTLPVARELARFGIRVNTIAPGLIATPMMTGMPEDVQTSLAAQVPFPKRLGKPSEFARLAGHIIENVQINGEVIRLDGAIRMQAK